MQTEAATFAMRGLKWHVLGRMLTSRSFENMLVKGLRIGLEIF